MDNCLIIQLMKWNEACEYSEKKMLNFLLIWHKIADIKEDKIKPMIYHHNENINDNRIIMSLIQEEVKTSHCEKEMETPYNLTARV